MPQPSPRAVARLEDGLAVELGDLRARLRRALAVADEQQAAGRDDLAAATLEAERATLAKVHRRLEERLAAASVEREAEAVLAAVDGEVAAAPIAAGEPAPVGPVDAAPLRLVAAAVAAVLGIVLLSGPDLVGGGVTAAGFDAEADPSPDASDGVSGADPEDAGTG